MTIDQINRRYDAEIAEINTDLPDWAKRYDLYFIDSQRYDALATLAESEGRDADARADRIGARECRVMAKNIARRADKADRRKAA